MGAFCLIPPTITGSTHPVWLAVLQHFTNYWSAWMRWKIPSEKMYIPTYPYVMYKLERQEEGVKRMRRISQLSTHTYLSAMFSQHFSSLTADHLWMKRKKKPRKSSCSNIHSNDRVIKNLLLTCQATLGEMSHQSSFLSLKIYWTLCIMWKVLMLLQDGGLLWLA